MSASTHLRPAALLDRDGVLNFDAGYLYRAEDFQWLPGVMPALRTLQAKGYALVVVTNQSGIGRGRYSEADFAALSAWMLEQLRLEGIELVGIHHCPHLESAGCACRKPKPGLIEAAAREHGLDLAASFMVGDKPQDIEAARAAGVGRAYRVRSAYAPDDAAAPDAVVDGLLQLTHSLWPQA